MANKNKNPEVRFKGFTEDWKQKDLDEEVTFYSGLTYSPSNVVKKDGTLVLRSSNVKNGRIVFSDNVFVNSDVVNSDNVKIGDIIVVVRNGSRSLIGKHAVVKKEMTKTVIGAFMTGLRPKEPSFINALLNTNQFNKEIEKNLGATINQITTGAFRTMSFMFPKVTEQKQIGTFFQNLNTLIVQHQKKYDKLVILKKAMLDKMFPKNGATVPEIRFKGFTVDWEVKEIDKIANRYDNLRIPITANKRVKGKTPYYGANGIQDYVEGHTHDGEFILIAEDGANDLKNYPVQYVKGKIWVNNHAHVLQTKKNIADNNFLKRTISNTNIEPFLVGGGRAKLNAEIMMKIEVKIPTSIKEQQKIGDYFKNLDKQISLHKTQLDKLKNLKKACLSKMFVAQE